MPKELNALIIGELEEMLRGTQGGVAIDYQRTDANSLAAIRARMRDEQIKFRVVKNRLAGIALKNVGVAEAQPLVKGPTALAYGDEEQTFTAARALVELKKDHPGITFSGYFLAGETLIGEEPVLALAKTPSKKELLGMMAQVINAPGTMVAVGFQATINQVAYAFQALADKLEPGAEG